MAHNNAWANFRLLSVCAQLDQVELDKKRASFFPSIMKTLNHNLTVDWFYVDALEGGELGTKAWADEHPCKTMPELMAAQKAVDDRLINFTNNLSTPDLDKEVRMVRGDEVQNEAASRVLLHLLTHQIHHRGQVHAMLAGTSVKPPQLDKFFMAEEPDRRREDFENLGFSENKIWKT